MSFVVQKVTDKDIWEEFLQNIPHTPFLQSFTWGDFQKEIGNKFYRFGTFENDKLTGVASVYHIKAKLTSYLYVPWGPLLKSWEKDHVEKLIAELLKISKRENLDFIRFEPRTLGESESQILMKLGFKKTYYFTQPECTVLIDLSKSEDDLLSAMSSSTRYNVGMVERRGVKVRRGDLADLSIFEKLLKETAARHHFTIDIHPGYYRRQYEVLNKDLRSLRPGNLKVKTMEIFVAEFEKKPLASSLLTFYGDTATYLHAASTRAQAKLRAPYLLAWKSILESKNRGYKYFDFWGVAPEDASENHPWSGVTNFKLSFGGERMCYTPVFDLPTSNRYTLAKFIEIARKPLRRIIRFS